MRSFASENDWRPASLCSRMPWTPADGLDPRCWRSRAGQPGARSRLRLASARHRPSTNPPKRTRMRRTRVGTRQGMGIRTGHGCRLVLRGQQPADESDGPPHTRTCPRRRTGRMIHRSAVADARPQSHPRPGRPHTTFVRDAPPSGSLPRHHRRTVHEVRFGDRQTSTVRRGPLDLRPSSRGDPAA